MKAGTSAKITVGVVGILLASFLGWKTLHHGTTEVNEVKQAPVVQTQQSPLKQETFKLPQKARASKPSQITTPAEKEIGASEADKEDLFEAELAEFERLLEDWDLDKALAELSKPTEDSQEQEEAQTETPKIPSEQIEIFFDAWQLMNTTIDMEIEHDKLVAEAKNPDTPVEYREMLLEKARRLKEITDKYSREIQETMSSVLGMSVEKFEQFIRQIGVDNVPVLYPEMLTPETREIFEKIRTEERRKQ